MSGPGRMPVPGEEMLLHLAALTGMEIAPEYRAGVIRNLEILAAQAVLLAKAPVDQHVEPAPVFRA